MKRGLELVGTLILCATCLCACGDSSVIGPTGPFASPQPTPDIRVIRAGCAKLGPADAADVNFVAAELIRQGTDLQRVSDDLSGAVPGGDLLPDAQRALENAAGVVGRVRSSTLCDTLRRPLTAAAAQLTGRDQSLVEAVEHGGDTQAALRAAETTYQDLDIQVKAVPLPPTG